MFVPRRDNTLNKGGRDMQIGHWDAERLIFDGEILTTDSGRELPLKLLTQQEYNNLWESIPMRQCYRMEQSPFLQSNGYRCIVTDSLIACISQTGNGIPVNASVYPA